MDALAIIFAVWIVLPLFAIALAVAFYVPWARRRHQRPTSDRWTIRGAGRTRRGRCIATSDGLRPRPLAGRRP
jgi:hypothetical protein